MPAFYNFIDNPENLVTYSTYNDSTWSNVFSAGATLTTGISAPDGTNTAVRFSCNNTTNALLRVNFPSFTPNGTDQYTTSFYVRLISGTGSASTDLSDGAPSTSYNSQLITNTWVRVFTTGTPTATAKSFIDLFSDNNTNYVLDFWGVQVEKKSSLGQYVPTTGNIVTGNDGTLYSFDGVFVSRDLVRSGVLWTWGINTNGDLGSNNTIGISTPITTFAGQGNWKQISLSGGIKINGDLWIWGTGASGRLGNATVTNALTPITTFAGGTNWKQLSSSNTNAAAIKTDGTLWMWGSGADGKLGNASTIDSSTPITTFAGGTNWRQVSCGGFHITAIKTDGTLWTWGNGSNGRLGNASTTNNSTPITTFAGGTGWKQVNVGTGPSAEGSHTAAIKTDGTLWIWGSGAQAKLGNNTINNSSTPVTTFAGGTNWKQVSCGYRNTAAIKTDGTLWTWGNNVAGQLGINDTLTRSTPVTSLIGGTNWKQVSISGGTSGIGGVDFITTIKQDGTLWVWGNNSNGQLGINNTVNRSTPVTTFIGGTTWKQVSFSFAIDNR